MKYAVAFIIGYLLGSINPAYIMGRIKGIDIREYGTFNAGASNATFMFGWWAFFVVYFVDIAKTLISFLIARYLFNEYSVSILAACACVVGHCFPFYMGFRGGKGFACYTAVAFLVDWRAFLVIAVIGVCAALLSNWVVSATLTFIILTPIWIAVSRPNEFLTLIFVSIASFVILHKHFTNFVKLYHHQEIGLNKCYLGTNIKADKQTTKAAQ